jgi:hypothetical protein
MTEEILSHDSGAVQPEVVDIGEAPAEQGEIVSLARVLALESPRFPVTFFPSIGGITKDEELVSLDELRVKVCTVARQKKEQLPLLDLRRFGDAPSEKGCLRDGANAREATGAGGDYDAEVMSLEEGRNALREAGIGALIYTSRPIHRRGPGGGCSARSAA